MFFLVPETAQLTLEQIDDYWLSGRKAWKTSTSQNKNIILGQAVDHTNEKGYNGKGEMDDL